MSRLRFGVLSYLNCLPATLALEQGRVGGEDLVVERGTPADLNYKMRSGALDVSVVSVAEYLGNSELYAPLGGYALWCDGPVQSVCLYSPYSRAELSARGGLVGVTPESATSVALAEILLGGAPTEPFSSLDAAHQGLRSGHYSAVLLIGDRALEPPAWTAPFATHDLGAWWRDETGHPMTYAIWIARGDLDGAKIARARGLLEDSLRQGERDRATVLKEGARRSALSEARLAAYLKQIHFRTNPSSEAGLAEFRRRLRRGCTV